MYNEPRPGEGEKNKEQLELCRCQYNYKPVKKDRGVPHFQLFAGIKGEFW
jgi:hypothetical protein